MSAFVPLGLCLFMAGFDPSNLFKPELSIISTAAEDMNPTSLEYRLDHGHLLYVEGKLGRGVQGRILIDFGAHSQFMSPKFAYRNGIVLDKLPNPRNLTLFEGSNPSNRKITHGCTSGLSIGKHTEILSWKITRLQKDSDMVSGIGWLRHHNPRIDWAANSITFDSRFDQRQCFSDPYSLIY
jgi:hypothetical protein